MFKYKGIKERLLEVRAKQVYDSMNNEKIRADMDYIAMMCDVELDSDSSTEETDNE